MGLAETAWDLGAGFAAAGRALPAGLAAGLGGGDFALAVGFFWTALEAGVLLK
jgi:hypothetical protein